MHNLKRMLLVSACIVALAVPTGVSATELVTDTATTAEVTDTDNTVEESDEISDVTDVADEVVTEEPDTSATDETITDETITEVSEDPETEGEGEGEGEEEEVKNGLVVEDGATYFYKEGRMIKDRVVLAEDGCYYYLQPDGKVYTTTGTLITDRVTGKTYTFRSNGKAYTSCVKEVDGKYYFFSVGGFIYGKKGEIRKVGGYYYSFNEDGTVMINKKRIKIGNYYYYFGPTGKAVTDKWKTMSGRKIYFNQYGRAVTEAWKFDGDKLYYLGANGLSVSGFKKRGDNWCYLDKNTYECIYSGKDGNALHKAYTNIKSTSSSSEYLITVDTTYCRLCIFKGSANNWEPFRVWKCSPGKSSTPTIKGTFYVGSKGYSFGGSDYTCYWYTQISGNYLFHSVLYQRGTFKIRDGRLGFNLSHGCVRLDIKNAKWIYDSIPRGTKIRIWS